MNNDPTPHSALPAPHSLAIPPTSSPEPPAPSSAPNRGRPRKLNDLKRHEICALVAGGCSLREAAKYVGCGINTIRRELERNAQFSESLRSSQMDAQLSPLLAMQQAVTKHWRAAAWMLERAYPERFARRDPAASTARQARRLLNSVIDIVRSEIPGHYALARLERRLRVAFDDSIRAASDSRRTSGELRQALEILDRREKPNHASCSNGDNDAVTSPEVGQALPDGDFDSRVGTDFRPQSRTTYNGAPRPNVSAAQPYEVGGATAADYPGSKPPHN